MKRKKKILYMMIALSLSLTACGSGKMGEDRASMENADKDTDVSSDETFSPEEEEARPDAGESNSALVSDGNEDISLPVAESVYTYGEMSVTIPESWIGKVSVKESDNGFWFVQNASAEKDPQMGYMCGFFRSKEIVYNFAGEIPLACTDDTLYYAQEPTDVPCDTDPEIMNEYGKLMSRLPQVRRSLKVADEDARYAGGEYVMFGSDVVEIPEDLLAGLNEHELWLARNEIYARHGRKFDNYALRNYFAGCSWYQGVTEAKDFDEGVLSEIEKTNITRLKSAEAKRKEERPYPVRYGAEQVAQEDLDSDGKKEKVFLKTKKHPEYSYEDQIILCIDKAEYDLTDMGLYFESADTDEFYITDIWSWEDGLEVAVLDYGPSNDYVTHFFRYDGQLSYVGAVYGFPFKEYQGFDGFYMDGNICCEMRADLISSAYAYGMWWGDVTTHTLFYQEGNYRMLNDGRHRLLTDLPVYEQMDTQTDTFVMESGQEVCFAETDAKEWIGVKSMQDGVVGYIRYVDCLVDPIGKEPRDVFTDLQYFD